MWKLVENVRRFPRRGGRGLCVHGTVSFHRAGSRHMLAAQKPGPDSHRTLRPVVDPDTAWSVIALVNLAKVTHTNFRRAINTSPRPNRRHSPRPNHAPTSFDIGFSLNPCPRKPGAP